RSASGTTVYAGSTYRRRIDAGGDREIYLVRAGERVVAEVTRSLSGGSDKVIYIHDDHLGSTDVTTGAGGSAIRRTSFDAWGTSRSPDWSSTAPGPLLSTTDPGFTGHTHDDELGLIDMRGRIYDPRIGRFLSVDPLVGSGALTQA